jgi:dihydropteroate synthase
MGVCNVTPDSFSDGGAFATVERARARVDALLAEGADVVDIGGESTRPGAAPVQAAEQLARVLDVVRHAVERGACVSIDTGDPEVADACLAAGAVAVNDATCLRDVRLARVAGDHDAAYVLMHTRGAPAEMTRLTSYGDVVDDIVGEWEAAACRATESPTGLAREALLFDPGIGFAKTAEQSIELLRRLPELARRVVVPVVVGASRKSFLRAIDAGAGANDGGRIGGSIAAALHAARFGARLVRVHDVRATRQALDLTRLLHA